MQDIKVDLKRRGQGSRMLMRALRAHAGAAAFSALAVFTGLGAWHMYGKMALAAQSEADARKELASVQAQQAVIEGQLQNLSTPIGVEGELRRRYGVAKPGEGVIEIMQSQATTSRGAPAESDNFFSRVWHALIP